MDTNVKQGIIGEDLAVKYLLSLNYKILERNWRFGRKEIDIIANDKGELVIVEVKLRTADYAGEPYEAVNSRKQNNIIIAAEEYIIDNNLDIETRFDIVSILLMDNNYEIDHIKDAFTSSF